MRRQPFSSHAILLHGPRKSGTSLLHNLLDGGSQILMLPGELKIKRSWRNYVEEKDLPLLYLQKGRHDFPRMHEITERILRVRPDFGFIGLSREQSTALFDFDSFATNLSALLQSETPISYRDIIRHDVESFADALRQKHHYSHWAAKEVGSNSSRIVSQFSATFPESKMIYLARDPRFVVRSILLDRKRKGIQLKASQIWLECVKTQKAVDFVFEQATKGQFVITYENLTTNTEAVMRKLAEYLEVDFEPIFCEPTVLGVPAVVRTSSQKTTSVFQQSENWTAGLNAKQILCMKAFFKFKKYSQRNSKNYKESVALLS